jgi:hypothetical protein
MKEDGTFAFGAESLCFSCAFSGFLWNRRVIAAESLRNRFAFAAQSLRNRD